MVFLNPNVSDIRLLQGLGVIRKLSCASVPCTVEDGSTGGA